MDWAITIVVAVVAVLAIKQWVVNPYRIPSSSMEPTLHCARSQPGCMARFSDRVLASRFLYHFIDPKRGDVIVFDTPVEAVVRCGTGGTFVKRIVGTPGDVLAQREGVLFVNGQRQREPYVEESGRSGDFGPLRVPDGHYFMMGDNREQSCDSRVWGPIERGAIIGKVFAIYWPPQRIGFR